MNNINCRSPLAMLALAGLLAGCNNPVSSEEHSEPEGVVIRAGTTEVVRVVGDGAGGTVTGMLAVDAGAQSALLTVVFVDEDGHDLVLDPGEYSLQVEPSSSATATWQGSAGAGFTGRVTGHAAGATTLQVVLWHGGHEDAGPFVVPVTVTAIAP